MSEQDWGAAFDIFVAVYVEKYPTELNAILIYAQHIKDLMRNGAHWHMYDTQLRRDREFTKCSWQIVRQDLQLRAFRPPQQQQAPRSNNAFKPKLSKGYCFAYHNKDKVCTRENCRFKHTCPRCSGPHPQYLRCNSSTNPSNRNLPTPVRVEALSELLPGYHNAERVVSGFTHGFMLNFKGPETPLSSHNASSVLMNEQVVADKIKKELEMGRITGPFLEPSPA